MYFLKKTNKHSRLPCINISTNTEYLKDGSEAWESKSSHSDRFLVAMGFQSASFIESQESKWHETSTRILVFKSEVGKPPIFYETAVWTLGFERTVERFRTENITGLSLLGILLMKLSEGTLLGDSERDWTYMELMGIFFNALSHVSCVQKDRAFQKTILWQTEWSRKN